MKKDVPQYKVENIAIVIVPREKGKDEELWDTYIVNLKQQPIKSVLVSSKGYGEIQGEKMKTTILRHFFAEIEAESFAQIEPIQVTLFDITNEYWVSFMVEDYMYDKKYVFVKGSINEKNLTLIPFLNKKGVMIK